MVTMSDELLPKDWKGDPVPKSLVEDLADVLSHTVVGWKDVLGVDLSEAPEVQRVMARFRLERDHQHRIEQYGLEVEQDCTVFGNSLHSRIDGVIQRTDPATWMVRIVEDPHG